MMFVPSEHDERFVKQFVLPLIVEDEDGVGILGTGALLEFSGELLLVTASHVLRELEHNAERVGLPESPTGEGRVPVFTLGNLDLWLPPAERESLFDVAVAQIRNPSAIDRLRSWPHLKPEFFRSARRVLP